MAYKYFIYSSEQLKFRKEVEQKMGKRFRVGEVFVNGKKYPFTELSSSPMSRYSDFKVVAEGELGTMKYTMPSI